MLAGAGIALTTSLVGCSTSSGGSSSIPSSPESYPANTGGIDHFDPERTVETIELGSREGVDEQFDPHDVVLWNHGGVPEISLRIIAYEPASVVHDQTHEVPEDTTLAVTLLEPSLYLVEVTIPSMEATTLRVDCASFDCNESATMIEVRANGALPSTVISTLAGCPSAPC